MLREISRRNVIAVVIMFITILATLYYNYYEFIRKDKQKDFNKSMAWNIGILTIGVWYVTTYKSLPGDV